MTASKIQSHPNTYLTSAASTPRNNTITAYNNPGQARRFVCGAKRNLFGKPDPIETKRLYDESVQQDRQRFMSRFGYDTVAGKFVNHSSISSHSSSSSAATSSLRGSPTRDHCRSNETANKGLCKDDPRKPYTRQ